MDSMPDSTAPDRGGFGGHARGDRDYRRALIALFFAGVATFAQLYSPQAVLPQISEQLDIGAADSALLVSAATIGLAAGVIPWSMAADRFGRVRAMTVASVGATFLALVIPFLPTLPLLIGARLVEGALVGGVPAVAIAYLSEEIAPAHVARAAATYIAGTSIGGLSGRLVSGPVADLVDVLPLDHDALPGWRAGMLAVAVLCAAAAIVFIRLVPAARSRHRPVVGIARTLGRHLRDPRLLALYAQGLLLMGGFVAMYNYLAFRLVAAPYDLSPALVSLIFVAYLAGTWSSSRAGSLVGRFGRRPVLLGGSLVMLAGVAMTMASAVVVIVAGLVVATAGFFAAHAIASGWTGVAAAQGKAQSSSLYNLAYYGGSSLFGWLGGMFFTAAGWTGTAGMVAALVVVSVAVTLLVLPREARR